MGGGGGTVKMREARIDYLENIKLGGRSSHTDCLRGKKGEPETRNQERTADHRYWGRSFLLGMLTRRIKIFAYASILRDTVPFVHLLVAIEMTTTTSNKKLDSDDRKLGVLGEKENVGNFLDPAGSPELPRIVSSSRTPKIRKLNYSKNKNFLHRNLHTLHTINKHVSGYEKCTKKYSPKALAFAIFAQTHCQYCHTPSIHSLFGYKMPSRLRFIQTSRLRSAIHRVYPLIPPCQSPLQDEGYSPSPSVAKK